MVWGTLLLVTALIVLIASQWPSAKPFYHRLQADWTLLSFGLYGATVMALFFTFDDYVGEVLYVTTASLALDGGGWGYLYFRSTWSGLLALIIGITPAMMIAAMGKGILFSNPSWPNRIGLTWQTEVLRNLTLWGWLLFVF